MGNLLAGLVRNFLLLRDLFGYAIPGAVVLAAAKRALDFDVSTLPLANDSVWLKAIVFLTASYVIGHVLAAIFFSPLDLLSALKFIADRGTAQADSSAARDVAAKDSAAKDTAARDAAAKNAAAKDAAARDAAYYRYLYPFMFNEADRRETLTVLRLCLAVSLIVVALIFGSSAKLFPWSLGVGIFMIFNAIISLWVARRSVKTAIEASKKAEEKNIAAFTWR